MYFDGILLKIHTFLYTHLNIMVFATPYVTSVRYVHCFSHFSHVVLNYNDMCIKVYAVHDCAVDFHGFMNFRIKNQGEL